MKPTTKQERESQSSRGIALVTTLLLLSLFSVMTLSMVIAVNSDTLIDGYYRNFRGSFYASDSGLNAARQQLANQIQNTAISSTWTAATGTPALAVSPLQMVTNLESSSTGFGANQSILGSQASWPASFKVDTTAANTWVICAQGASGCATSPQPTCTPTPQCSTTGSSLAGITLLTYTYPYQITVIGEARNNEQNTVTEAGNITLGVKITPSTGTSTSFAAFGTLLDQYAICSSPFVPGTMSGKVYSNDSMNFGDSGLVGSTKYVFPGAVDVVNTAGVGYMYSDGTCNKSTATSNTYGGTTINPTFTGGLASGVAKAPLPTDTFNQQLAVLDGVGSCATSSICTPGTGSGSGVSTASAAMGVLETAAGTAWTTAATSGVYIPHSGSTLTGLGPGTPPAFGGIYVQGNVDQMTLTATTVGSGSSAVKKQVITIKQGSSTTTVTLDLTNQTTEIQDNASHDSGAMAGLPQNMVGTSPTEGCMVYVTGNISSNTSATAPTGLSGPSSGAAIQDGSGVTITAGGTISITGNITYSTEPVTLTPADTSTGLVGGNVLGIFTTGGNIQFQPPSNVSTMEVDASMATINAASGSSYGLTATWNTIGTLNIVGGRVQNKALSGSSLGARNIYFDQRFAGGFAPPWFPTTTLGTTTTYTGVVQAPSINRVSWVNKTAE
jgi:Tfp pilus assembly protein PilX